MTERQGNTDMPEFTRTRNAAQVERTSKWDLIAAIAEDATASGLLITSMESQLAAKAAFESVGNDYTDGTIKDLTLVAKFDHEATDDQRSAWRSSGWTVVRRFAEAGWSQEAVADWYRSGPPGGTSKRAAESAVRNAAGPKREPAPKQIDDAWREWLNAVNRVLTDGARLAERTEAEGVELGAHSGVAHLIYERLTERKLDAELRELFASVESDA